MWIETALKDLALDTTVACSAITLMTYMYVITQVFSALTAYQFAADGRCHITAVL
jgi:hypothetical protein